MNNWKIKVIGISKSYNRSGYIISKKTTIKYIDCPGIDFIKKYTDNSGNISNEGLKLFNNEFKTKILNSFEATSAKLLYKNEEIDDDPIENINTNKLPSINDKNYINNDYSSVRTIKLANKSKTIKELVL